MLKISLSPELPLIEQIVASLRCRIDDHLLRSGQRLPSIREFAAEHGISRHTVIEAYDRLAAQGYIQSQRGSGFYVAGRPREVGAGSTPTLRERPVDVVWLLRQMFQESEVTGDGSRRILAGAGCLPDEWLDEEGIRRQLRALARREDLKISSYGTAQGYLPLREQLAVKLDGIAIASHPSQIVTTFGALQAIDLFMRAFLKPGDAVLVDDPGYFNLFGTLRLFGAHALPVPRTPQGPDLAALESLLAEHKPKAFFTQSVLHNPTSSNLSPATAFRVLQLAEKHDFLIVEDDVHGDLHAGNATRLATLDQLNRVIYIGGFSKTLSGDLRVGFIAARQDIAHDLADIKLLTCVATSEFAERLVYLMLTEGHYRKYLERLQNRLAGAFAATMKQIDRLGLEAFGEPRSGMFVWARSPKIEDSAPLAARAAQEGILLAPGNVFRPQIEPSPWIRLNVARCNEIRLWRFLEAQIAP